MTCKNLPARSGQQFSISHGDYKAVVTELGATLRKLTYRGEDLIVSLGPDDVVSCCHGQILIPFPNRVEGGEYTFEGKTYTLPIDEHARNNAIHGYGYRSYWKLESLTEESVALTWRTPNMAGYP
ncbi:MAG TPA: aldose epimerase, partial [Bifidobacterium dentium]|nr:aldose epimerase [Bifidobacterium dentium]